MSLGVRGTQGLVTDFHQKKPKGEMLPGGDCLAAK